MISILRKVTAKVPAVEQLGAAPLLSVVGQAGGLPEPVSEPVNSM